MASFAALALRNTKTAPADFNATAYFKDDLLTKWQNDRERLATRLEWKYANTACQEISSTEEKLECSFARAIQGVDFTIKDLKDTYGINPQQMEAISSAYYDAVILNKANQPDASAKDFRNAADIHLSSYIRENNDHTKYELINAHRMLLKAAEKDHLYSPLGDFMWDRSQYDAAHRYYMQGSKEELPRLLRGIENIVDRRSGPDIYFDARKRETDILLNKFFGP